MRTVTFADPGLADFLNERFVLAWVNVAPSAREGRAAEPQPEYGPAEMAAYPEGGGGTNIRTFYCAPDGTVRHATQGFWRPEAYREEAERALDRFLKAKEVGFARTERDLVRAKLLQEAEALEKAHPEEKGRPLRESVVLRRVAALRLMGQTYLETAPRVGAPVARIMKDIREESDHVDIMR